MIVKMQCSRSAEASADLVHNTAFIQHIPHRRPCPPRGPRLDRPGPLPSSSAALVPEELMKRAARCTSDADRLVGASADQPAAVGVNAGRRPALDRRANETSPAALVKTMQPARRRR